MRALLGAVRWTLAALGGLALLVVLFVGGLYWLARPSADQSLSIPQLSAPAEAVFDQDGVPRIRAANLKDAALVLGYVHARDRMFQMDMMRRLASGRLAALFGRAALPVDREMRTLGLARRAEADAEALPPDAKAMLQAYADGVNAWIARRGRFAAPEFVALGAPGPWKPSDSLLWGKLMGLWLSMNWRQELARWKLIGRMPRAEILALWPNQPEQGAPDAPLQQAFAPASGAARYADLSRPLPFPSQEAAQESNEWAVDGVHSATGAPLLAGDPHLDFGFPSIWYLVRIDTPEGTLAGATSPGVPLLVLGHNGHIAWTFTTTGADVQDIFVETPVGPDAYATPDGPRPFAVREERIRVRGGPDEVLKVRETRHGPVISDLLDARGALLAVDMANLQPDDMAAEGLLALDRAHSVEEAGKAAAMITSPVQNLLVADRQRIALFVTGRVPLRKSGDGAMPVAGADGAHDWIGWAAGERLPHYVAPASGVLVNANERIAPPDFPVFMGRDVFADWRAQRIRRLLAAGGKLTLDDFARMQVDDVSAMAKQVLPALLSVPVPDGIAAKARALLVGWDGRMAMDAPQPLIFEAWIGRFYAKIRARTDAGAAMAPETEFVPEALLPGGAGLCGGDCAALLTQALTEAAADLAARFGPDPDAWRWGAAHRAVFAHPLLGRLPVIGAFGRITIKVPGAASTIFATANGPTDFTATHGPSFRGVYDLADLDRSRFMIAPGESGDFLRPGARAFLQRWRDGGTVLLTAAAQHETGRIRLSP
ncbi:MAG TPA: penicillin acylase family protein [Acetobacteraceae bacterium]|nr:penicillin acylase family protein [Acetobacteraceae bacterium]